MQLGLLCPVYRCWLLFATTTAAAKFPWHFTLHKCQVESPTQISANSRPRYIWGYMHCIWADQVHLAQQMSIYELFDNRQFSWQICSNAPPPLMYASINNKYHFEKSLDLFLCIFFATSTHLLEQRVHDENASKHVVFTSTGLTFNI